MNHTIVALAALSFLVVATAGAAAQTPDAATSFDQRAILRLRAENNQAIADHDIKKFSPMFAEDSGFIFSDGRTAVGRAGITAALTADFANPAFVTYVRSPTTITISENGARAVEHGVWTALKREERGETRYGGDYAAHWARTPDGWTVRGELFVKLRCTGPLCTP
jgi:uncharacterized protein (TIGR02246 family)